MNGMDDGFIHIFDSRRQHLVLPIVEHKRQENCATADCFCPNGDTERSGGLNGSGTLAL